MHVTDAIDCMVSRPVASRVTLQQHAISSGASTVAAVITLTYKSAGASLHVAEATDCDAHVEVISYSSTTVCVDLKHSSA
jgi:hypothetical protein